MQKFQRKEVVANPPNFISKILSPAGGVNGPDLSSPRYFHWQKPQAL